MGDYTDGVSPSNRKFLRAAFVRGDLYDTASEMFDEAAKKQAQRFLHLVRGTEGRWDFLLGGHHYHEYVKDRMVRTTDLDIADALRTPHLGLGMAAVSYQYPDGRMFVLWARHGEGSGDSFAAPLNSVEKQMRGFDADVYVIAHHHKLVAGASARLDEDYDSRTGLRAKTSRLVGAGSWMRGFAKDRVSYAEEGMMVPLAIGAPVIRIQKQANDFRVRVEV